MKYIKTTTISIPEIRWEAIGDWIIARFLEMFGSDELINQYLSSGRKQFDKSKYVELATWMNAQWLMDWVISIADYQEFLNWLRVILPSKFRKKGTAWSPWFDNVMPMVDLWMGPMTFEAADKWAKEQLAIVNN